MIKLEDLQPKTVVRGILMHCLVTVTSVQRRRGGARILAITEESSRGAVTSKALPGRDRPSKFVKTQERYQPFDFRAQQEVHDAPGRAPDRKPHLGRISV